MKGIWKLATLSIVLGINTVSISDAQNEPEKKPVKYPLSMEVRPLARQFYQLLDQKDLVGARTVIDRALSIQPKSGYLLDCLSLLHQQSGKLDEAVEDLTKAIGFEPDNDDLWFKRGWMRHQQGKLQDALDDMTHALGLNPRNPEILAQRAGIWRDMGDKKKCLKDLDDAIAVDPTCVNAYNNRALFRFESGDKAGSLQDINRALSLAPNDRAVLYNLSIIKSLKAGQSLDPGSTGYSAGTNGWRDITPDNVPEGKSAKEYYKLGVKYAAANWPEHARDALKRAIKLDPKGPFGHNAFVYLQTHIPVVPVLPETLSEFRTGIHAIEIQNFDQAIQELSKCIQRHPGFEWPYLQLSRVYNDQGKLEFAKEYAQKALKINPKYAEAWIFLAQIHTKQKQIGLAKECAH